MEQSTKDLIEAALTRKSKIYFDLYSTVQDNEEDFIEFIRGMELLVPTDDLLEFLNMIDDEYDLFEEPMKGEMWEYLHTTLYFETTKCYTNLNISERDNYNQEWFIRETLDSLDLIDHLSFIQMVYDIDMLRETYGYKLHQLSMAVLNVQSVVGTQLKESLNGLSILDQAFHDLSNKIDVFAEAAGRVENK